METQLERKAFLDHRWHPRRDHPRPSGDHSALQYSVVAASLLGVEAQALGEKLKGFGDEELSGARELIEKNSSLATFTVGAPPKEMIKALQEAIEPTGREGRSEAVEHLLEHLIMRKQHQIDFLKRAAA
jgi:hypothetical protein